MPQPKRSKAAARPTVRAECFLLCDYVQFVHGKFNILGGGWDRVNPERLPLPYQFHIALKLMVAGAVPGQRIRLRMELTDETGRTMEQPPLDMSVQVVPEADAAGEEIPLMLPLGVELTLVLPGRYTLELYANDDIIGQTGFRVVEPPISAPAADLGPGEILSPTSARPG